MFLGVALYGFTNLISAVQKNSSINVRSKKLVKDYQGESNFNFERIKAKPEIENQLNQKRGIFFEAI